MPSSSCRTSYAGNVWKYSVYQTSQGLRPGVSVPTLMLFFLDKGLGLAQCMILLAVLNASIFVLVTSRSSWTGSATS